MTATESTELYRLRVGKKRGNASWGDWQYFEERERWEVALLDAAISEKANGNSRPWAPWRAFRDWYKVFVEKEGEAHVDSVFGAEKLVEGRWVEVKYTLHPPRLEFDE